MRAHPTPADDAPRPTLVIVVMGVAGAGKTTVGQRLAATLGWPFADADAYHSPENVARMRRGEGLTDAERQPWLATLAALIADHVARRAPLVLACSALRRTYRTTLAPASLGDAVRFVHLQVSAATLAERLATRPGHYAPPALLASQLATLEPPAPDEGVLTLDGEQPVEAIVAEIVERV
jgi:gluconokinase